MLRSHWKCYEIFPLRKLWHLQIWSRQRDEEGHPRRLPVSHEFSERLLVCLPRNKASGAGRFASQKVHWTPLMKKSRSLVRFGYFRSSPYHWCLDFFISNWWLNSTYTCAPLVSQSFTYLRRFLMTCLTPRRLHLNLGHHQKMRQELSFLRSFKVFSSLKHKGIEKHVLFGPCLIEWEGVLCLDLVLLSSTIQQL